jgi:hypothetical protein
MGFDTLKEVLDVVVIPMVLGVIALLWPKIQSAHRRRAFRSPIMRELQELEQYPKAPREDMDWTRTCSGMHSLSGMM